YAIEEVYFHLKGERWWKLDPINFTDLDVRFPGWRDDIGRTIPPVEGDAITITGITQSVPVVVTAPSHGFAVDDAVIITGVLGMTEINGTTYYVRTVVDTDNIELKDIDDNDVDSTGFTAYISGGTINTIGPTTYNFDSRPGSPQYYYWDRERDLFGIWQPPDSDNGTSSNVHVYYFKEHVSLGDDAETPDIPEPMHQSIVDWVVYQGFESRGWGDKANDAFAKYISKIKDYQIERKREREDDVLTMKNYRNVTDADN
ncbi:MAG: phage adaptor protein, partial [Candidatus Thorarchaeota archaeon]